MEPEINLGLSETVEAGTISLVLSKPEFITLADEINKTATQ
jgi:hypothetical protein